MKKIILFSLCLFSFFGVVKSEEVASQEFTTYENAKKLRELAGRSSSVQRSRLEKLYNLSHDAELKKQNFMQELKRCEFDGNCENSQILEGCIKEYGKSYLDLLDFVTQNLDLPEVKECDEFIAKITG